MFKKHFKRLWSTDNMKKKQKKTDFNGYVYYFCVDYHDTSVDDIKDNHEYLMKKNKMV